MLRPKEQSLVSLVIPKEHCYTFVKALGNLKK